MPQPLTLLINSIASFYLLPFLSVGIYAIWAKKYSLANFLLFFGGVNALHSIRLIYQKSVTGYIIWFVAWALILYASYWNNQHEKPKWLISTAEWREERKESVNVKTEQEISPNLNRRVKLN